MDRSEKVPVKIARDFVMIITSFYKEKNIRIVKQLAQYIDHTALTAEKTEQDIL